LHLPNQLSDKKEFSIMRLVFQIAFAVLAGIGALYAGISNFISPAYVLNSFYGVSLADLGAQAELAVSSQARLLAGMWVAAGVFALASIRNFERHGDVIRLILAGLALGAVGEFVSAYLSGTTVLSAGIKAGIQIILYAGLELWRVALTRKHDSVPTSITA
jgi:hypothetical protein